jgi:hypothetical protein
MPPYNGEPRLARKDSFISRSRCRQCSVQVLPKWALGLLGLFIPIMKEFHEMAYQYDRDDVFDSGKFNKRFDFQPTAPKDGVMATLKAIGG